MTNTATDAGDDVEFVGMVSALEQSESFLPKGPSFNIANIERAARAHEDAAFDRVLIASFSRSPDSLLVAQHAASVTERLKFMIAHRPGFTAPTVAARQFATLDHLTNGRAGVHIITGGNDVDLRQDGDWTVKDDRYARTDEYLDVMKLEWTSPVPFDYAGRFYRFEKAFGAIQPLQQPHIPIFFGGSSPAAIAVAGKHAQIYALWGETLDQARDAIAQVRAAAAAHGREHELRLSMSFRPILAETEEKAWARADRILEATIANRTAKGLALSGHAPPNAGAQRLLDAAAQGARLDTCLWTGVAAVTGEGNCTGLVGTGEQVADALLAYHDLGVKTFLIRGFDPHDDTLDYGRNLLPIFRAKLKARQREHALA